MSVHLTTVITRELRALAREIRAYPDDESLWQPIPGAANAGGTLALHLAGNIQHYVGARLGGSDYARDRAAEFARRGVSRLELMAEVEKAIAAVEHTLPAMQPHVWAADFPEVVGGRIIRTDEFVLHLATHLAWHLGQMDYHRRAVTGEAAKIGAVAVTELGTARLA
ncbi:MAG TPA: DinB family protein [Gemmatimonadales bacterium]